MEKVSIIIPAYNIDRYIGKAIDSALSQTYGNTEIIIINDGSTDNTEKEILAHIQGHANCRYILQENSGVYKARKKAIEASEGEYIIFLDGDDYLREDYVETMLHAARERNLDICACEYVRVTDNYSFPKKVEDPGILEGEEYLAKTIEEKIPAYLCCKIYRRHLFSEIPETDGIWFGEDKLLNIKIGTRCPRFGFIDYFGYFYYQRKGSARHTRYTFEYLIDYNREIEKILEVLPAEKRRYYLTENKLVWYRSYIQRSGNKWQGNNPYSIALRNEVLSDKAMYGNVLDGEDIFNIKVYRHRITSLLIYAKAFFKRISRSIYMRISRKPEEGVS